MPTNLRHVNPPLPAHSARSGSSFAPPPSRARSTSPWHSVRWRFVATERTTRSARGGQVCSLRVRATPRTQGGRRLDEVLLLRQAEGRGRGAYRWTGRLHLQRVHRALQRDHREGTQTEPLAAIRAERQSQLTRCAPVSLG